MSSTELSLAAASEMAETYGQTTAQVLTVQRTVAKNTTPEELAMFLGLGRRYDLDPFAKEIWCVVPMKDGHRKTDNDGQLAAPMIMAGRDGFLKIANRHEAYEGMASGVVYNGEDFHLTQTDDPGGPVQFLHRVDYATRAQKGGKPIIAYAIVYRSDRSIPMVEVASWDQYGRKNAEGSAYTSWAKYPDAMLVKVAESIALRKAFSITGVSSAEEVEGVDLEDRVVPERVPLRQPRASLRSRGIDQPTRQRESVRVDVQDRTDVELPAEPVWAEGDAHPEAGDVPWLPPDPNEEGQATLDVDEKGGKADE